MHEINPQRDKFTRNMIHKLSSCSAARQINVAVDCRSLCHFLSKSVKRRATLDPHLCLLVIFITVMLKHLEIRWVGISIIIRRLISKLREVCVCAIITEKKPSLQMRSTEPKEFFEYSRVFRFLNYVTCPWTIIANLTAISDWPWLTALIPKLFQFFSACRS